MSVFFSLKSQDSRSFDFGGGVQMAAGPPSISLNVYIHHKLYRHDISQLVKPCHMRPLAEPCPARLVMHSSLQMVELGFTEAKLPR